MGCVWKTIEGRRVRVGLAAPARIPKSVLVMSVRERLEALGLVYAAASPRITIEELRDATIRVWKDPEIGYMAEARLSPTAPPIYRRLTDEEARLIEAGKTPPELIARLFQPESPGVE